VFTCVYVDEMRFRQSAQRHSGSVVAKPVAPNRSRMMT
jgi:hypothetical protein